MARYFFHLAMGTDDLDQEGVELDSLDEARRIGVKFLAQSLLDHADAFWISPEWRLDVANEEGLTLFSVHAFAQDAPVVAITATIQPDPV